MQEPLLNLRNLCTCVMVARTGSVTRSADQLYRAQSAVTRSVRDIENALSVALFERTAHGMLPTAYAQAVIARVERAQRELSQGHQELLALRRAGGQSPSMHMLMNERRLQMFVDLTEHRHVRRVASLHGLSQPAVSLAIRELESQLDTLLFERTARGLAPTEAALMLAFRVRRALSELRIIPADVAAIRGSMEGVVTVGALPLARTMLLPTAMARILARHPRLKFRTIESPFEALETALRGGDIDMIVGALRPVGANSDLKTESLFHEALSIVTRHGHPLTRQREIRAGDLLRADWVMSRRGSPTRDLLAHAFVRMGQEVPQPVVETGDLAVLRGLLVESDMVTAISPQQLRYEIDAGMLCALDFPLADTTRDIGITVRSSAVPSPGAVLLVDALRQVAGERFAQGPSSRTMAVPGG